MPRESRAGQAALVLRAYAGRGPRDLSSSALMLTAEALAAGGDEVRGAERIARLAADATGAAACVIWRSAVRGAAGCSPAPASRTSAPCRPFADAVLEARASGLDDLDDSSGRVLPARPAADRRAPARVPVVGRAARERARRIAAFATRAAQALRALRARGRAPSRARAHRATCSPSSTRRPRSSRSRTRSRPPSTACPRLLDVRVGRRLPPRGRPARDCAACEVTGRTSVVAERLLELALGPFRARGFVASTDAARRPAPRAVRAAVEEAAIEAVHAVPLARAGRRDRPARASTRRRACADRRPVRAARARSRRRSRSPSRTPAARGPKRAGGRAEASARRRGRRARRLSALYEISRSFAQSLSLEETLDAIATTVVELLEVDVAVIRVPDERGDVLTQRGPRRGAAARRGDARGLQSPST